MLFFYSKRAKTKWKPEVLYKKLKTILLAFIFFPDPQLHQIFKPMRKFFCTFFPNVVTLEIRQKKWPNWRVESIIVSHFFFWVESFSVALSTLNTVIKFQLLEDIYWFSYGFPKDTSKIESTRYFTRCKANAKPQRIDQAITVGSRKKPQGVGFFRAISK